VIGHEASPTGQSLGQLRQFSVAVHAPSPHVGPAGHVVDTFGAHSGVHVVQHSSSAQPAAPS